MRSRTRKESITYRIVQEVLTNVLKHAHATTVSVIVERRVHVVEDDGVGFDRSQGRGEGIGGQQVGLIGMTERATLAGGALTIERAPGAGTAIDLRIPPAGKYLPPTMRACTARQRRSPLHFVCHRC